jgi:hypothetical protein
MIEKTSSLVVVDKRPYRKIAQLNWGLSKDQMRGMHVHHRIPLSQGGTNDPSNLYVCSPSFHRWVWHSGEEWIEWAQKGSVAGAIALRQRRSSDPEWAEQERIRNSKKAKKSHEYYRGTEEYSERQRVKSIKTHTVKREHWSSEDYDVVWAAHLDGLTSGYRIARRVGATQWKTYANMLKYATLGFSFEQLTQVEEYTKELERISSSSVAHLITRYDD